MFQNNLNQNLEGFGFHLIAWLLCTWKTIPDLAEQWEWLIVSLAVESPAWFVRQDPGKTRILRKSYESMSSRKRIHEESVPQACERSPLEATSSSGRRACNSQVLQNQSSSYAACVVQSEFSTPGDTLLIFVSSCSERGLKKLCFFCRQENKITNSQHSSSSSFYSK
jgi:hypothetical protein